MQIGEFELMDLVRIGGATIACFIAYFVVGFITRKIVGFVSNRLPQSTEDILEFFLKYTFYLVVVAAILNLAGFNMSALLGAAGVFGVAIGFASQTTISNVISGVFLIVEHSLRVGDVIKYEGVQGRIQEIGLLSMMLKTIDNKLIRVPNERIIKSNVINITALRQRIIVFKASIYKKDDPAKLQKLLRDAWNTMEFALKEKDLSISYDVASADMVGLSINMWVKTSDIIAARSEYIRLCSLEAEKQGMSLYISPQL